MAPSPEIQKPEVSNTSDIYAKRPYVDGSKRLVDGQIKPWSGECAEVISPVYCTETGERIIIGKQATLSSLESLEAGEAAVKAWAQGCGAWPRMTLEQRIAAVESFMEKLYKVRSDIINVLQWEICKNDADAAKEFDRTMDFIRAVIAAAREVDSRPQECVDGIHAVVRRSPVGVMMNLGPMNYPFNETYATLIPGILMGNTVVMKIPNTGGLAHFLTMEAYAEAFPPGVVNFISGRGRDTMPPLMETGNIDVLAFVGSSRAADSLIKNHPKPHRLKLLLSLDAKNLGIVMPDADLDLAAKEILMGSTSFNGQRCTAIKLIMVHESVAAEFNQKLCANMSALSAGLPFGKHSITPLPMDASKPEYFKQLVDDAISHGAKVINECGGQHDRSIFFPAVVHPVTSAMKVWHEEQFGPVVPVAEYDSLDEVYNYLKAAPFGQQAAIFTSSSPAAQPSEQLSELLDICALSTTRVNVNVQCSRGPDNFPFGGRRSSALGTISTTDVLKELSIETMVASKQETTLSRTISGSAVFTSRNKAKCDESSASDFDKWVGA